MKKIIIDLDGTLTINSKDDYLFKPVNTGVLQKLRSYRNLGFQIIIYTSRNMRTYKNNIGQINANTLPIIIDWLKKNDVPYDEIHIGKPWCGNDGFYVDDKSIRPSEFIKLSYSEIKNLLSPTQKSE